MKKMINKKNIILGIVILIGILVIVFLLLSFKGKKPQESKKEEEKTNTYSSTDADVSVLNFRKELNVSINLSINEGDIIYEIQYCPKDTEKKIESADISGSISTPVLYKDNDKNRMKLVQLEVKDLKKKENNCFGMNNKYHEDNTSFVKSTLPPEVLANRIDYTNIAVDYER